MCRPPVRAKGYSHTIQVIAPVKKHWSLRTFGIEPIWGSKLQSHDPALLARRWRVLVWRGRVMHNVIIILYYPHFNTIIMVQLLFPNSMHVMTSHCIQYHAIHIISQTWMFILFNIECIQCHVWNLCITLSRNCAINHLPLILDFKHRRWQCHAWMKNLLTS